MLTKEVELYLQLCGQQNMHHKHIRQASPGEISWVIEFFNWDLATMLFQTVTLKKDTLILEVWDKSCDDGIPTFSEVVFSDISIELLHIKLRKIASECSIQILQNFSIKHYLDELEQLTSKYINPKPYATYSTNVVKGNVVELVNFCNKAKKIDTTIQELEEKIERALKILRDDHPQK